MVAKTMVRLGSLVETPYGEGVATGIEGVSVYVQLRALPELPPLRFDSAEVHAVGETVAPAPPERRDASEFKQALT
jgi:hypothetical protein